jgi:spore coat protein CotF
MSPCSPDEKAEDAFLAKDALSMEKHVAGSYNTSIFEFSSPVLRDTLAHIEKEEQNHGEMLWCYLNANGMYS